MRLLMMAEETWIGWLRARLCPEVPRPVRALGINRVR
jgi:hypothetical protein